MSRRKQAKPRFLKHDKTDVDEDDGVDGNNLDKQNLDDDDDDGLEVECVDDDDNEGDFEIDNKFIGTETVNIHHNNFSPKSLLHSPSKKENIEEKIIKVIQSEEMNEMLENRDQLDLNHDVKEIVKLSEEENEKFFENGEEEFGDLDENFDDDDDDDDIDSCSDSFCSELRQLKLFKLIHYATRPNARIPATNKKGMWKPTNKKGMWNV